MATKSLRPMPFGATVTFFMLSSDVVVAARHGRLEVKDIIFCRTDEAWISRTLVQGVAALDCLDGLLFFSRAAGDPQCGRAHLHAIRRRLLAEEGQGGRLPARVPPRLCR